MRFEFWRTVAVLTATMLACSLPVYDRAEITPGPAVLAGAGAGTGLAISGYAVAQNLPLGMPHLDYYLDGIVTARFGYGFSRRFGLLVTGSLGYGTWLSRRPNAPYESAALKPLIYDLSLGFKIKTGSRAALVPSIGTGIFDLNLLYDFNRYYSGNFGFGFRGLGAGLTGTVYYPGPWRLHIGGRVNVPWGFQDPPGVSLGAGFEYCPRRR